MSKNTKSFIYLCFSENGTPSSKRVLGCLMLLIVLIILFIFSITEGCTNNVKDIVELIIITSGALLGISSVTSIWKPNNNQNQENDTNEEE